ncbi:MAG: hypothetical protein KDA17_07765 [Candidatus Saccharibacteria bacterium]|nr:hypothetical protein [Candidatus Saccharibacteria bacterium]
MAKYDLTGSLEREFTFSINDEEFSFKKPTVREMRALAKKFSAINTEEDAERQAELSEAAMNELYKCVTNVRGERHISEVLDEQPSDVQMLFNDMIQKELGVK